MAPPRFATLRVFMAEVAAKPVNFTFLIVESAIYLGRSKNIPKNCLL
jgi:hypothetical protein